MVFVISLGANNTIEIFVRFSLVFLLQDIFVQKRKSFPKYFTTNSNDYPSGRGIFRGGGSVMGKIQESWKNSLDLGDLIRRS